MKPIRRCHTTHVLGAPAGWNARKDGPCEGLPVTRPEDEAVFFSYWAPTWREWFAVLCGRPVRLVLVGASHPPVMIDTEE